MVMLGCKENSDVTWLTAIVNPIVVPPHAEAKVSQRVLGRYRDHLGSRAVPESGESAGEAAVPGSSS